MSERPCDEYREAVRHLCPALTETSISVTDDVFREFMETAYSEAKSELESGDDDEVGEQTRQGQRDAVFVFAVGAFSCGVLWAARDIVDNLPEQPSVRELGNIIRELMPLPKDLLKSEDAERMARWIEVNAIKLRWDEDRGHYVME
jgi:hypothetical protein